MNVTRDDVASALADLQAAYGPPFGAGSKDALAMAEVWNRSLSDCQTHDLKRATADLIRDRPSSSRWPAPADLRGRCLALESHRAKAREQQDADGVFCLRCHTRDLITLLNGRFMAFHAETCPGLHDDDRLDLRAALNAGHPVWRNGIAPKPVRQPARLENYTPPEDT